jgi:hypothetical protein
MFFLVSIGSVNAIGKRLAHGGAGVESAKDDNGLNGGAGELRCYVIGDSRQADDLDIEHLASGLRTLQICATEVLETEQQRSTDNRPLDDVGVNGQLVADSGSYQVGSIGIEPLLYQQIDLPQIDHAEVDRELLRLANAGP